MVGAGIAQRFRVEEAGRDADREGAGAVRGIDVMGRVAHDEDLPRVERLAEQVPARSSARRVSSVLSLESEP